MMALTHVMSKLRVKGEEQYETMNVSDTFPNPHYELLCSAVAAWKVLRKGVGGPDGPRIPA